MSKIALITGSTDGIGKATAMALVKRDYTIHLLGRSKEKGERALEELKSISDKNHKLYLVDLSSIQANKQFVNKYLEENDRLDVLILNALAFPEKGMKTVDGFDLTFSVGYISRYIFSILLNPLLESTAGSRVIHVGQGASAGVVNYEAVKNPIKVGEKYTLVDKVKTTNQPYVANRYFSLLLNRETGISVPHEYYHPGTVDTQQVKDSPAVLRFIGKLVGEIIQPEKSGDLLADHIEDTTASEVAGKYYSKGKQKKIAPKLFATKERFAELVEFSEEETGVKAL